LDHINILFVELLCWQEVVLGSSQENIFENADDPLKDENGKILTVDEIIKTFKEHYRFKKEINRLK